MFAQNKRGRHSEAPKGDIEPSPVIHLKELPPHTLEKDLLQLLDVYGQIREVAMMPQYNQALVEFTDQSVAEHVVKKFSDEPLRIGEHSIDVSFSTSKHVMQRASSKETSPDPSDPLSTLNHVLLYTVFNVQHPVTLKVIHQITSMFAEVVRIVMFRKSNIQAMVEFKSVEDARRVKQNLNGADIYSGCCTLKVDYARPTRLTVKRNDEDTWDFENNNAADAEPDDSVGSSRRMHGSLLGSYYEHDMRPPHANGSFHTPCFQTPPGRSLMRLPTTPDSSRYHPHPPTPVAMVFNLNPDEMNCERLFNLFCPYGNVIRVKFLHSTQGTAMVEMGDPESVDRLMDNLSGYTLMGSQLVIRRSKQNEVLNNTLPHKLFDGSPSFQDFSSSRNNRYTTMASASKNRLFKPSSTLHYWNCPLGFNLDDMRVICENLHAPLPSKFAAYTKGSGRSSSGLVEWDNESDALAALAIVNHHEIPNPDDGRHTFILKLSFAAESIRDTNH
ncbi:Heteroproteinous nuclear ribonucleoprotein L [Clonorchis sinensis]|uniref:Heteroproteinous nuclear ribonucleoprotein L n=2 Tax=Clonorchis sinensis TaxID=79923 RepID=A0A8T1MZ94_CLOSI|nr:Heteroproteinous nuclear ribonucleoprotein L [Clonorchis sinensis]